jgi:hypothetical protein
LRARMFLLVLERVLLLCHRMQKAQIELPVSPQPTAAFAKEKKRKVGGGSAMARKTPARREDDTALQGSRVLAVRYILCGLEARCIS